MSGIKGFSSSLKAIMAKFGSAPHTLEQLYTSLSRLGPFKAGLDTAPRWLASLSTGNTLDALAWSTSIMNTKRMLQITGHALKVGDAIRLMSGPNQYQEVGIFKVIDGNTVLLDQELAAAPIGGETFTHLRYVTPTVDVNGNISIVEGVSTVVDFLDVGALIPTGGSAIPASAAAPLQVVAALAQNVTRMQIISDVGEFVNLYDNIAGGPGDLIAHLTLTPDEIVDVDIPAGTSLFIRNQKNATIDQPGSVMSVNFIG